MVIKLSPLNRQMIGHDCPDHIYEMTGVISLNFYKKWKGVIALNISTKRQGVIALNEDTNQVRRECP